MTKELEDGDGKEEGFEEHLKKRVQEPQDLDPPAENDQKKGRTGPYFPEIFLG